MKNRPHTEAQTGRGERVSDRRRIEETAKDGEGERERDREKERERERERERDRQTAVNERGFRHNTSEGLQDVRFLIDSQPRERERGGERERK